MIHDQPIPIEIIRLNSVSTEIAIIVTDLVTKKSIVARRRVSPKITQQIIITITTEGEIITLIVIVMATTTALIVEIIIGMVEIATDLTTGAVTKIIALKERETIIIQETTKMLLHQTLIHSMHR